MEDKFQRKINYMRMSITDRCNLHCQYCMPNGLENPLPMERLLTYEELLQVAKAAVACGITRFKVTGGEPLVRRGAVDFMASLKALPGVEQVTITTNGLLLSEALPRFQEMGLDGINVSLDTLIPERFYEITGFDALDKVLQSIKEAVACGIPVKLNTVLQKGVNEDEIFALLALCKKYPLDLRFIEMMPIGYGKEQNGISNDFLLEKLKKIYSGITKDISTHGNGPAKYYKIPGFQGSVGFISAMHGKFCSHCNRIRLTSTGKIKPCLCFGNSINVRECLRNPAFSEEQREEILLEKIQESIWAKPESHCFEKLSEVTEKREMGRIGG